jgi:hypothetical protein
MAEKSTGSPSMAVVEASSGDGHRYTAQIVESTDAGLKLKVRHPFDVGSMVRIDLPCQELGPVTTVLACVMNRKNDGKDLWQLACQFCTELDDDDLTSLGVKRELIAKPDGDNRSYKRYPAKAQVLFRDMRSRKEPIYPGTVLNASPTGIGLRVKEALIPGSLLDLTVQGERGQKLFEILACVVYRHTEKEDEYTVGCNFIRELSEEELNSLS